MRFIFAPLLLVAGVLCIKYSVYITDEFTGPIDFAEKYLGTGVGAGTYTWWKLFGLAICIVAVLWLFGKLNFTPPQPAAQPLSLLAMMLI